MAQGSGRTLDPAPIRPGTFLFLQGPISPFFDRIGAALRARGHTVRRINLCFGDRLFWRRSPATNYRGNLEDWPRFIEEYLEREGVTDLVLLGEQRAYHRAAIEAAKARGIVVTVTDFGYLRPDFITLERNGMNRESELPRDPAAIRDLAACSPPTDLARRHEDSYWTMVAWDVAYHLLSLLFRFTHPHYRTHQIYHPMQVYLGGGLRLFLARWREPRAAKTVESVRRGGAPYFVYPLQLMSDFSIRAYSDYPGVDAATEEVLRSFARNAPSETQLIVKIHPRDPGLEKWPRFVANLARELDIAARVHFIDGGPLDKLIEGAAGVVVVNSTVGLQALMAGCPVIALGEAIYRIVGLTHPGSLDGFWTDPRAPDSELCADFVRALDGALQIRGTFYSRAGLNTAVDNATRRLHHGWITMPEPVASRATGEPELAASGAFAFREHS